MAVTFDRDDIVGALNELVDVLIEAGADSQIRIVGGAAISVCFTRETTTADVDALYGSDPVVEAAASEIARRRGWPDNWLNDNVKQFASHYDTNDDWIDFKVRDGVTLRIAGAELLLAMKLLASRGVRDSQDIDVLLAACQIETFENALQLFERYYPEEELSERAMTQLNARLGPASN
jgi:hypothetical protein